MPHLESVRIDKWLWAVRLYKSRSLAVHACQAGHVTLGGNRVKPAREVKIGDVITAQTGRICRQVKVLALLEHRVGARQVPDYLEDLTPEQEYAKARTPLQPPLIHYPRGLGRPTKKQRRQLDSLL